MDLLEKIWRQYVQGKIKREEPFFSETKIKNSEICTKIEEIQEFSNLEHILQIDKCIEKKYQPPAQIKKIIKTINKNEEYILNIDKELTLDESLKSHAIRIIETGKYLDSRLEQEIRKNANLFNTKYFDLETTHFLIPTYITKQEKILQNIDELKLISQLESLRKKNSLTHQEKKRIEEIKTRIKEQQHIEKKAKQLQKDYSCLQLHPKTKKYLENKQTEIQPIFGKGLLNEAESFKSAKAYTILEELQIEISDVLHNYDSLLTRQKKIKLKREQTTNYLAQYKEIENERELSYAKKVIFECASFSDNKLLFRDDIVNIQNNYTRIQEQIDIYEQKKSIEEEKKRRAQNIFQIRTKRNEEQEELEKTIKKLTSEKNELEHKTKATELENQNKIQSYKQKLIEKENEFLKKIVQTELEKEKNINNTYQNENQPLKEKINELQAQEQYTKARSEQNKKTEYVQKNNDTYSLSMHLYEIGYPKSHYYFNLRNRLLEDNFSDALQELNKFQVRCEDDKKYLNKVLEGLTLAIKKPVSTFDFAFAEIFKKKTEHLIAAYTN